VRAKALANRAICDSTRRQYEASLHRYQLWCTRGGFAPALSAMTPISISNWLADEAGDKRVQRDTLAALRTGVSTLWREALLPGPNPTLHDVVERVLTGYGKQNAVVEAEAKKLRREKGTIALTVELLAEVAAVAKGGGSPEDQLYWAAACAAVFTLSRCIELFGASRVKRSPISANALEFRNRYDFPARGIRPDTVHERSIPKLFVFSLGPTKADQMGKNKPVPNAARVAIEALWVWVHTRKRLGGTDDGPLFAIPGQKPIALTHLLRRVAMWVQITHGGPLPTVTCKVFRRGGNQTLMASGAALPNIQAMGRWKDSRMPDVYNGPSAALARAILTSHEMGKIFDEAQTPKNARC
jgi:hypothetical protein